MEKGKIVVIACTIVIICIAVGVTLYVTVGSKKFDKDKKKELANKVEKEYGKLVKLEYTITGGDLPGISLPGLMTDEVKRKVLPRNYLKRNSRI